MVKHFLALVTAVASSPAMAEEAEAARDWTASVGGAAIISADADDQLQGSLAITRLFSSGYVGVSASHADTGRSPGVINAIPASSTQIALSGGLTRGAWSFDGYASAGRRDFDRELVGPNGSRARISTSGDSLGAGLSISHSFAMARSQWLTPSIAVDHFEVDIARTATTAGGAIASVRETSRGTSLTTGLAWQLGFGAADQHSVAPYAALVVSSDNSAYSPGSGGQALANLLAVRGGGVSDEWGEAGVSAALQLAPRLTLTLGAARTIGYIGPEITTLQTGLSLSL